MVGVAQLVELKVVILAVAGSIPVAHPIFQNPFRRVKKRTSIGVRFFSVSFFPFYAIPRYNVYDFVQLAHILVMDVR